MSRAAAGYAVAAGELDEHMASCPSCPYGSPCGSGDAIAEAEFRSWRELQRSDPQTAASHPARRGYA